MQKRGLSSSSKGSHTGLLGRMGVPPDLRSVEAAPWPFRQIQGFRARPRNLQTVNVSSAPDSVVLGSHDAVRGVSLPGKMLWSSFLLLRKKKHVEPCGVHTCRACPLWCPGFLPRFLPRLSFVGGPGPYSENGEVRGFPAVSLQLTDRR